MARDQRPIVAPGSKSTDQALALLQMNDQLHRMTGLLDRMAVSATHVIEEWKKLHDIPQQIVHNHFLIDSLMGRPPGGGGGGGLIVGAGAGGGNLIIPGAGKVGAGTQLPVLQHLSTPEIFSQKKAPGPGQQDTRFDQGPNKPGPEAFIEKLGKGLENIGNAFIRLVGNVTGVKYGASHTVAKLMQLEGARAMMGMGGSDSRGGYGGYGGGGGRSGGRFRYATTNEVAGVVDSPQAGLGGEPFMEQRDTSYIAGGTNLVGELYHNRYTFDESHQWTEVLSHEHMSKLHAHLALQARMTPEEQEDILQRLERARTIEDEDPEKTPPPVTSPRKLGAIILKGSSKAGPTPPSGADPAPNLKASGLNVWPRPGAPAAPAPTAPAPAVAPSGGSPTPAPSVQQPGPTVTPPVQPSLAPTPVPSVPQAPTPTSTPAVQTPAPVSAPTPPPPAVEPPPVAVEPGKKGRKRGEPKLNDPTKPKTSRKPRTLKPKGSDVIPNTLGVGVDDAGDIISEPVLFDPEDQGVDDIIGGSVDLKGPKLPPAADPDREDVDFMTRAVSITGPDDPEDVNAILPDSVDVPKLTEPGKKGRKPKKTVASTPQVNAPTPTAGMKKQEVDELIGKLAATKVYRWSGETKRVHASAVLDKAKLRNLEGYLSGTKPFNQQAFSRYVEQLKEAKNVRGPDDAGIPAVDPDLIKQLEAAGQGVSQPQPQPQPQPSLTPSVEASSGVKPKRGRKKKEDKVVSIDDESTGPEKATVARNAPVNPGASAGGGGASSSGGGSAASSTKQPSSQQVRARYHHIFIDQLSKHMREADNLQADNQDMAAEGAAFKRNQGSGSGSGLEGTNAARAANDAERHSRNKFIEALDAFSRKSLMAGGVMGEAGAPDAMATLSGSFKLLAAEIGATLLPSIMQLSRAVQGVARWFRGQSEGFKGGVGTAAGIGLGVAGTYAAAKTLGLTSAAGWLFAGGGAAAGAGAAVSGGVMAGGMAAGMKHPYLAAAAVAAAGFTAANVAGHATSSDAERRFSATKDTWLDPLMGGIDKWWFDGVNKRTEDALLGADSPEEFRGLTNAREIEGTTTYKRYMKKNDKTGLEEFDFEGAQADRSKFRDRAKQHMANAESYSGQWYNPFRAGRTADQLKYALEETEKAKKLDTILGYEQDKAAGKELKVPESGEMLKEKEQDLLKKATPLLMDFATKTQPGYFSPEDIAKKVQLESLGTTPLQEELRKIHGETLQRMLEENKTSNRLLAAMMEKLGITKLAKNNSGN